jgi:hypothetical protein
MATSVVMDCGNLKTRGDGTKRGSPSGYVLIVLWVLGFVTFHVIGGFIHILLVVAVLMILVRIVQGRR